MEEIFAEHSYCDPAFTPNDLWLQQVDISPGLGYFVRKTRLLQACSGGNLVDPNPGESVSQLLAKWQAGDTAALDALVTHVYSDLRRVAHNYLRKERPGHTLQSTALVHEAYLRLAKQEKIRFENRAHFFAVLARVMRQILVDYARNKHAAKRDAIKLTLDEAIAAGPVRELSVVALDDALQALSRLDTRQAQIVELRFFAGLSSEETALVLDISAATVKREWATARLWLKKQLAHEGLA